MKRWTWLVIAAQADQKLPNGARLRTDIQGADHFQVAETALGKDIQYLGTHKEPLGITDGKRPPVIINGEGVYEYRHNPTGGLVYVCDPTAVQKPSVTAALKETPNEAPATLPAPQCLRFSSSRRGS